jgi:tetrapyrrole methylase family protein/MazG family protein
MSPRPAPELDPRAAAADPRVVAFARLVAIVDRLRAEDGCPWDRKQTLASMAPHVVEEAHETLEAVETGSDAQAAEECGDVLMGVALLCRIAQDEGRFNLAQAAQLIAEKLVRRHPHVFGEVEARTPEQVLANWEAIKKAEREEVQEDASALAGVPASLPALQRANRVGGKAVSAGFRWETPAGAAAKLREEVAELDEALAGVDLSRDGMPGASGAERAAIAHELGDVLLAAAFLARYLDLDPERLCREAVRRFEARFRAMETGLPRPMKDCSLDEMMAGWHAAKAAEARRA